MSIKDVFESGKHTSNVAHFAAIVNLAGVDGKVDKVESSILKRLADKLDISQDEYHQIVKHPEKYSTSPPYGAKKRLDRLYDLFSTIYADHYMNAHEQKLVLRYAMELGYSSEKAKEIVDSSARIFGGRLTFEEYRTLIKG